MTDPHVQGSGYVDFKATVHPRVAGGAPLLGWARVVDLIDRVDAGDSVEEVARDFDVPSAQVRAVLAPEWRELVRRLDA